MGNYYTFGIGQPNLEAASGDVSGVTDRVRLQAAVDSASANGTPVWVGKGNYIVDSAVVLADNVHIEFEPGTSIKMRDSFTALATLVNGNTRVSIRDTTGIAVGMYVGDEAGSLSAGTPFGSIPWGCTVSSVNATSVVLSSAPTSSGSATLRFYPNENCIRATQVDGWSLTCRGGWATIDGNIAHAYPWPTASSDATRNAIRIVSCNDWLIDGIEGANAFWHGLIGVGEMQGVRVNRYRGTGNGFRGIHIHGEAVSGNTTPEVSNMFFGDIEVNGNGVKSFYARQGSEYNSGCFVVFENCRNVQVQSVRAINERGLGVHLSGAAGAFASAGDFSRQIQFNQIQTDNCNIGVGLFAGVSNVQFGSVVARGYHAQIAACATLDSANTTNYYVDDSGAVQTLTTRTVQLPAGSIAAHGIREGFWCYATDGTGFPTDGCQVWSVSEGTGTGGTDLIEVFDPLSQTGNPYTTAVGTVALQICGGATYGMFLSTTVATGVIDNVHVGSLHVDGYGRSGVASNLSSSEYRYRRISFGEMTIRYCGRQGNILSSVNGLSIGKMHTENCALQKMDNSSGSSSGGNTNFLQNCVNFSIRDLSRAQTAAWSDYNEALRCDDKCRNGHIWPTALTANVGAGFDVMNILTTAGAGDNGNGFTGPVYIYNPRNSDGTLIAVNTVATENQITRTNANACIRVVFTDTP